MAWNLSIILCPRPGSSVVEHLFGKEEVGSSILLLGSRFNLNLRDLLLFGHSLTLKSHASSLDMYPYWIYDSLSIGKRSSRDFRIKYTMTGLTQLPERLTKRRSTAF